MNKLCGCRLEPLRTRRSASCSTSRLGGTSRHAGRQVSDVSDDVRRAAVMAFRGLDSVEKG